jgi:adenylate cyclase
MTEIENNPSKTNSDYVDSSNVVDMMLSTSDSKILDTESMILETQKRVWASLKKGYQYTGVVNDSEAFLRKNVFSKINMVVLYVDLVGSTQMALELPEEKIAIIISCFAQEMAFVIKQHQGYVLKFVGDAVIAYFDATDNGLLASDNAVNCAKSMLTVIQKGINPILNQYDYPDLMAKIGLDFGENIVVRYGADAERSQVDLIGAAMNIAAKIQSMAKPNQILLGSDVYERVHPSTKSLLKQVIWKNNEWKYRSRITGELYNVYEFK